MTLTSKKPWDELRKWRHVFCRLFGIAWGKRKLYAKKPFIAFHGIVELFPTFTSQITGLIATTYESCLLSHWALNEDSGRDIAFPYSQMLYCYLRVRLIIHSPKLAVNIPWDQANFIGCHKVI